MKNAILILHIVLMSLSCNLLYGQNKARFSDFKPGMIDEQLVEKALKVANERAVNLRCSELYTKGVITSTGWQLEYDNNGFVKGRKIHIELYCERIHQHCGIANFTFRQKHEVDGDFYPKLLFDKVGYMYDVDCE